MTLERAKEIFYLMWTDRKHVDPVILFEDMLEKGLINIREFSVINSACPACIIARERSFVLDNGFTCNYCNYCPIDFSYLSSEERFGKCGHPQSRRRRWIRAAIHSDTKECEAIAKEIIEKTVWKGV